ncbi:hypothetical protein AmDm5_1837 [Acetobacter malorum]|nr:hypothetical protein AmDm5_1837 [Acetobacter malorum]
MDGTLYTNASYRMVLMYGFFGEIQAVIFLSVRDYQILLLL